MPKRLLFTMVKNTDFLGDGDTNPFHFRHYNMNYFALCVNGKQIPSGSLHLNMGHKNTSVMDYRTLFEASGIHHSNAGLHITHDMYITAYFMLLFVLTPDKSA
jgi:xylose isomerase